MGGRARSCVQHLGRWVPGLKPKREELIWAASERASHSGSQTLELLQELLRVRVVFKDDVDSVELEARRLPRESLLPLLGGLGRRASMSKTVFVSLVQSLWHVQSHKHESINTVESWRPPRKGPLPQLALSWDVQGGGAVLNYVVLQRCWSLRKSISWRICSWICFYYDCIFLDDANNTVLYQQHLTKAIERDNKD